MGLPKLSFIIPQQFALPKAFQTQIFDLRLSFLTLFQDGTRLRIKKASHLRDRLCSETGI